MKLLLSFFFKNIFLQKLTLKRLQLNHKLVFVHSQLLLTSTIRNWKIGDWHLHLFICNILVCNKISEFMKACASGNWVKVWPLNLNIILSKFPCRWLQRIPRKNELTRILIMMTSFPIMGKKSMNQRTWGQKVILMPMEMLEKHTKMNWIMET